MTLDRHLLSLTLDARLVAYAAQSWNGHEAVYAFQQLTHLLPVFERNLASMYGGYGIGDARRGWGVAADLLSAMIGVTPTMASLRDAGFDAALSVGYLVPYTGKFALVSSPAAKKLVASSHDLESDALVLFARADAYDRTSRPLMQALRDELRAYDTNADGETVDGGFSFRKLALSTGDEPTDFPEWDGRPLFLHEQKALLDFLAKKVALEIVADNLVEDVLGEIVCRAAGLAITSHVTGEQIWNIDAVPYHVLRKPVSLVFGQVGTSILRSLRVFDQEAPALDRLYVAEMAVKMELGLDIERALAPTRNRLVDEAVAAFHTPVIDLRDSTTELERANQAARFIRSTQMAKLERFEFPDFGSETNEDD